MADDDSSDRIEEALTGQIRLAVTAAGLAGEAIARVRGEQQRQARAASEHEARALQSRLSAEWQTARAELAPVHRPEWWSSATTEQVGHASQVAKAWARDEPDAARAEQRISEELRSRYGIDPAGATADPAVVSAAGERTGQDRKRGAGERRAAADGRAEAQLLLAHADLQDRRADEDRKAEREADLSAETESTTEVSADLAPRGVQLASNGDAAQVRYDSAERREAAARDLSAQSVPKEAVTAKMCADVSQAKPATEAVTGSAPNRSARARKSRGRAAQVQRTGVER